MQTMSSPSSSMQLVVEARRIANLGTNLVLQLVCHTTDKKQVLGSQNVKDCEVAVHFAMADLAGKHKIPEGVASYLATQAWGQIKRQRQMISPRRI